MNLSGSLHLYLGWVLYGLPLGQPEKLEGIEGRGQSDLVRRFLHEGGNHFHNCRQTAGFITLEGAISEGE